MKSKITDYFFKKQKISLYEISLPTIHQTNQQQQYSTDEQQCHQIGSCLYTARMSKDRVHRYQCSSWSFRPSGIEWNVKRPAPHPKDMPIPPMLRLARLGNASNHLETLPISSRLAHPDQGSPNRVRAPHTFCGSGVVFATTRSFQEPVIIRHEQMIVSLVPPVALIGQSN